MIWTHQVQEILGFIFVPLMAVFSTIAIILASIGKWKDKRYENIVEASTTWRELAESREAEVRQLEKEKQFFKDENDRLRLRNNFLWSRITTQSQRDIVGSDGSIDGEIR